MEKIKSFFYSHNIKKDDKIAVAFSGGSDSLGLLVLMSRFINKDHLVALYVNHRLRSAEELHKESELNRINCQQIGVAYEELWLEENQIEKLAKRKDIGTEAAAREFRYQLLTDYCSSHGYPTLATAHTNNDQLETMVMRTFNGSSPLALSCIREDWMFHGLRIIRPVLAYSKDELRLELKINGLSWSDDSTNEEDNFLRNKIRTQLVPIISRVFPDADKIVARRAYLSTGYAELVEEKVDSVYNGSPVLFLDTYKKQIPIVRIKILLKWLRAYGVEPTSRLMHIDGILLSQEEGIHRFDQYTITVKGGMVSEEPHVNDVHHCHKIEKGKNKIYQLGDSLELLVTDDLTQDDGLTLRIADEDLHNPVVLRSLEPGDSLMTKGGKVNVNKLITSWKLSAEAKKKCLVLEDKKGVQAIFLRHKGGRDRLSKELKGSLVSKTVRLYSIFNKDRESE